MAASETFRSRASAGGSEEGRLDEFEEAWACSEWLDAVCTGLEAGLSLLQAYGMATDFLSPGRVRSDFARVHRALEAGAGFSEALATATGGARSPVVARILSSLRRSQVHGSRVVEALSHLRETTLTELRTRQEERVARLPVKMLFPLAVFVLPAILLLVCAPFVAEFAGRLR